MLRLTSCRCVLLDEDNLAGGCKYLIDAIRRAGLIPDDDPGSVKLEFFQVQVRTRAEQGTIVERIYPKDLPAEGTESAEERRTVKETE